MVPKFLALHEESSFIITNLWTQGDKFVELLPSPDDEKFGFIVFQ